MAPPRVLIVPGSARSQALSKRMAAAALAAIDRAAGAGTLIDLALFEMPLYHADPAALVGSSPGAFGGLRALIHLRDLLGYLGMVVIPQQAVIPRAHQAFDADGGLIDPTQRAALEAVAAALVRAAA